MTSIEELTRYDKTFVPDLVESHRYVLQAADYYVDRGFEVHVPPQRIAPTIEERGAYRDKGDLFVLVDGSWRLVSVVHWWDKNGDFDSAASFPWANVIVDEINMYDYFIRIGRRPWRYMKYNEPATGFLELDAEATRELWFERNVWDKPKGRYRLCYMCSKLHWIYKVA